MPRYIEAIYFVKQPEKNNLNSGPLRGFSVAFEIVDLITARIGDNTYLCGPKMPLEGELGRAALCKILAVTIAKVEG